MILKKALVASILMALCIIKVNAQDPVFSQFYAASMFLNPALAADKQPINFTVNNRLLTNQALAADNVAQFTAIVPFKLKFLSDYIKSDHTSGAAFSVYTETQGNDKELSTVGFLGTFAHNVQIANAHYLSFGLQGGYINRQHGSLNWGSQYNQDIGFDNQITPSLGNLNQRVQFGVINAGMVWFMNNSMLKGNLRQFNFDAFCGLSVSNMNRPNQSFYTDSVSKLPVNWKLHGGLKFHFNNAISVFPNFLLARQNKDNQLNLGAYASIKTNAAADILQREREGNDYSTIIGIWYRVGESIIASMGFQYMGYKMALSYDFSVNNNVSLNNRGKGAFEVSVKYCVPSKKQHLSRGLVYPTF